MLQTDARRAPVRKAVIERLAPLGRPLAVVGGLCLVAAILVAGWLAGDSSHLAGTNSVTPRDWVATIKAGERLCVRDLWMPAGANAVRLRLAGSKRDATRVGIAVATPGGTRVSTARLAAGHAGDLDFPVRPVDRTAAATLCVAPASSVKVAGTPAGEFGGLTYQPNRPVRPSGPPQAELDGKPFPHQVSVSFVEARTRSRAAALPDALRRAALFRAGFVGAWTYVVLFALLPVLWLAGLVLLLRRSPKPRFHPALVVALITFANAAVWAFVTPAFQGPDEEAHVIYAADLAETGSKPKADTTLPFASSEIRLALGAVNHYSVSQFPHAPPPWQAEQERAYNSLVQERRPARDDGGGEVGTVVYGPVYYAIPAAAYRLAGGSLFDRLLAMRLVSALLAALTAAFVYGTVRELLPRERWPAIAAGLAVGFQPMFGFISGVVTADTGVNLAGAALLYLVVRAMRRGLTPAAAIAILLVFVLGTLAKTTMIVFAPVLFLAFLILVRRRAGSWRSGSVAAAVAASACAYVAFTVALGRDLIPLSGGAGRSLAYLWQVFLPPLPFMEDLYTGAAHVPAWQFYVERLWGSFGWLSVDLPRPVFYGIAFAMLIAAALAVRTALRERSAIRARATELALLGLALIAFALAAHLAFVPDGPTSDVVEQGRYLFPAMTTLAVIAVGACYGLGRRLAPVMGALLVAAMMVLSGFAQLLVLVTYYT